MNLTLIIGVLWVFYRRFATIDRRLEDILHAVLKGHLSTLGQGLEISMKVVWQG